MKKLALFALLFGVGLALLVWLDRRGREAPPDDDPPVARDADRDGDARGPGDAPVPGGVDPLGGQEFEIGGALSFAQRDPQTGALQLEFEADDVAQSGPPARPRYTAQGLVVRQPDPATGELVRTTRARRAEFALEVSKNIETVRLADEGRAQLFDVTVTQHTGLPYAPAVITAQELEGYLERQTFRSLGDGLVTIDGVGLDIEGRGLELDGAAGSAALTGGGSLKVVDELGREATFASGEDGTLRVVRVGEPGAGVFEATADGRATLALVTLPALSLEADEIVIVGRRDGEGAMRIERATAKGSVVARHGTNTFRGGAARVEVLADGQLEQLVLEDEPQAALVLLDEDGAPVTVQVRGAGPLEVTVEEGVGRFALHGPARIEAPERDLVIDARGVVRGWAAKDRSEAVFEVRDRAVVTQGESRLATEHLDAVFHAGTEEHLEVLCRGPSEGTARDGQGTLISVSARELLELEVVGKAWTIPLARGVVAHALGGEPFRIAAGELREFDWAARTFEADGGVTYAGVLGEGSALRAVGEGGQEVRLYGVPEAPARVRFLPPVEKRARSGVEVATLEAIELEVTATKVEATGAVHGGLTAVGRTMSFRGDHARIDATLDEDGPTLFELTADDLEEIVLKRGDETTTVRADLLVASGRVVEEDATTSAELGDVVAIGDVVVHYEGQYEFEAQGSRFSLWGTNQDQARLEGEAGARVGIGGWLPKSNLPYDLTADWIESTPTKLVAERPHVELDLTLMPISGADGPGTRGMTVVDAARFTADQQGLHFAGPMHAEGTDETGVPVELRATQVDLFGEFEEGAETQDWAGAVRTFEARGDVTLVYGGLARARCARLFASRARVVLEGAPVTIDVGEVSIESAYIDVDVVDFLVAATRGIVRGGREDAEWSLSFASIRPVVQGADQMFVVASPRYTAATRAAQATFASVWVHPDRWRARGQEALWGAPLVLDEPISPPNPPPPPPKNDLIYDAFRKLADGTLPELVRALYLSGDVEVTQGGLRVARAEEVYFDLENRRAWLNDAELAYRLGGDDRVRTNAARFETSADGALLARQATLTACTHDDPHYVIETGELSLKPRDDGRWSFHALKNRVRFKRGVQLPLPPLGNVVLDQGGHFEGFEDDEGNVRTIKNIAIANTPRFGTSLATEGTFDVGRWGTRIAGWLGFDPARFRGHWNYEGAWLSSRGPLLGLGLELRERKPGRTGVEEFWLDLWARGIPDGGQDRGLLRVEPEDTSNLRYWLNARGRYPFDDRQWLDVVFNHQGDPGMQAEFFQREYLEFEERDNYLHWRKARDGSYFDAMYRWRQDAFRREVEELPSLGAYRGETELARVGSLAVQYSASLDLDHLRRRDGDPFFEGEFLDSYGVPDGLGDVSVLRADTQHRLAVPLQTGLAGLRATPFLEARLSAWDTGLDPDRSPTRAALFGGVDLATTLNKVWGEDAFHTLAPVARYRSELALEESGGAPVRFDRVDDPVAGDLAELGMRTLWRTADGPDYLDFEAVVGRETDRAPGLPDEEFGAVLGGYRTELFGLPTATRIDARYDLETSETTYSRTTFAVQPFEDLLLQLGHQRARGLDGTSLFETASLAARYTVDPKWEFEVRQQIAIANSGTLSSEVLLRRFSHDFLLEIAVSHRAGEGTGFGINFTPLLNWTRARLGILDDGGGNRGGYDF
jgi:hypothetical protein